MNEEKILTQSRLEELEALSRQGRRGLQRGEMRSVRVIENGGTVEMTLPCGRKAFVDAVDYPLVAEYSWRSDEVHPGIAYAKACVPGNCRKSIPMHRVVMGFPQGGIDHRDGNGLNNRRMNLRPATPTQNGQNRRRGSNTASRFKGVRQRRRGGKWMAYIKFNGEQRTIGWFQDEVTAARAYDWEASQCFGEFARLNFPDRTPEPVEIPPSRK